MSHSQTSKTRQSASSSWRPLARVAFAVELELASPELGVRLGQVRVAARTVVPIAAVHEDGHTPARVRDVRPAWCALPVQPIATMAGLTKGGTKLPFGLCVAGTVRLHDRAHGRRRRRRIGQLQARHVDEYATVNSDQWPCHGGGHLETRSMSRFARQPLGRPFALLPPLAMGENRHAGTSTLCSGCGRCLPFNRRFAHRYHRGTVPHDNPGSRPHDRPTSDLRRATRRQPYGGYRCHVIRGLRRNLGTRGEQSRCSPLTGRRNSPSRSRSQPSRFRWSTTAGG